VAQHRLISMDDTVIMKLPTEILRKMRSKSKMLDKIMTNYSKKAVPDCDFTTFLTYNHKLTKRERQIKLKRALARLI